HARARLARLRRRRLRLLALGIGVALVALVARLSVVQVLDGSRYAAYAASEVRQSVTLPATRGAIYDRTGQLIAVSEPRVDIVADDFLVQSPGAVAAQLAPLVGIPASRLEPALAQKNGYVVLVRQASAAVEAKVSALGVNGITFIPDSQRYYLDKSLFEPIVGGVNAAGQGDADLETQYDGVLAGHAGSEVLQESAAGQPLPAKAERVVAPAQGSGLVLTIDEPLQVEATNEVAAEMRRTGAHTGIAVIENSHTGSILAMVDLARTTKGAIVPAPSNLALTSIYQPGSVMKLATFSYSLQDHLISPTTAFSVPYQINVGGYWFQDAEFHPTQTMTASQILAQSSNVGTIEVSRLLGPQRLDQAFHALGFGNMTGLGWPGESQGILGSPATWFGSSLGSVPIGTGVAVTPMQVLDAYNSVADGGVLVSPRLVAGTVAANGNERLTSLAPGRRVLDPSTVGQLVPMLEGVVQDGTAVCAEVPGYTVAGKTGTAQVVNSTGTGYVTGDWNATFVGFVPAQAPQLSGIVVLNHPEPIYGGSVSAPVFGRIMSWALRHFDITAPPGGTTQTQSTPTTCNGQ
ncbi:MAG: peptidoglycan synthetase FtsI, partial [Acidimicrobiaceae bacterium]|nr:peptidoglycan synthetase FtsI [Acidimicrobiaceae bacterium]